MLNRRTLATVTASALLAAASLSSAQTPSPRAEDILRFREATPVVLPPVGDRSCAAERLTATSVAPGDLRVDTIGIDGATRVPPADLARETESLIGRSVDRATLDRLAERVGCVYRRRGYLYARATVEPGAEPGAWRLRVHEGRVAAVHVATGDADLDAFLRRAFGRVRPGEPLQADDLRQGLALAARHAVWSVSTRASRDPADPDAITLIVEAPKPRTTVFLSAQNNAPETVGRWWAGASVIGHGVTPLYERNTLGVFHSLEGDRQRGVQLSSQALLNDRGLGGRVDLAWYEQRPDERAPLPDTIGTTRLARAELDYPLTASPDLLVMGRAGFEAVDQETRLLGGPRTADDQVRVVYIGVGGERHDGEAVQTADLSVRKGVTLLGGSRRGDPLLSRPDAEPEAVVVRAEASASRPLAGGRVQARVRGQWADDPLLAYEEFTFGGAPGGRGLDPGALQGDRGVAVTLEWAGRTWAFGRVGVDPLAFVEAARAWNEDGFGPRRAHVALAGGGVRLHLDSRTVVDVVYAHPLDSEGVDKERFGPRVLVTLRTSVGLR